jgi:hypothetical protein
VSDGLGRVVDSNGVNLMLQFQFEMGGGGMKCC